MKEEKKKSSESSGGLPRRFLNLSNLFNHKKKDISRLRIQLKERDAQTFSSMKSLVEQIAETEEHLSYIIIEEYGKILASTPTFRKIFYYDDPDKPIKGRPCYSALKIPSDAPDYIHNLEQVLKTPERLEKQTTIYNGKGEEVIVRFTKYEPTIATIGDKNFSFTRVDIYEVGVVKRISEGGIKIIRKLHLINGEVNTLSEFITKKISDKSREKAEEDKKKILSGDYKKKTKVIAISGIAWKDKTPKQKRSAAKVRLKQRKKVKKKNN